MAQQAFTADRFFKTACLFEGSLLGLALLLGWLVDIDPLDALNFSESALIYGLYGTAPLFLLFLLMQQLPFKAFKEIQQLLLDTMGSYLSQYHWTDLLVLALVAGISEEALFRGLVQPWMEQAWGLSAGLIVSNILFGLVHAVTPLYAMLAMLMGFYLGWFMDYGDGRNLLTPMIIHAMYDFFAFLVLVRTYRATGLAGE